MGKHSSHLDDLVYLSDQEDKLVNSPGVREEKFCCSEFPRHDKVPHQYHLRSFMFSLSTSGIITMSGLHHSHLMLV